MSGQEFIAAAQVAEYSLPTRRRHAKTVPNLIHFRTQQVQPVSQASGSHRAGTRPEAAGKHTPRLYRSAEQGQGIKAQDDNVTARRQHPVNLAQEPVWIFGELEGVPIADWPERPRAYAIKDSVEGEELYHRQTRRAHSYGYEMPTLHDECRAALGLQMASCWGIHTDVPYVEQQIAAGIEEMGEHIETARRHGLAHVQPDLFGGLGEIKIIKIGKRTLVPVSESKAWQERKARASK